MWKFHSIAITLKSMSNQFETFNEFWPFYVGEHSRNDTRRLHFIGTLTIIPLCLGAILFNPYLALLIPVSAYGFAWFSHFFVEKNRPATFIYPLWSLLGDFKMFWFMCRGKMSAELIRCEKLNLVRSLADVSFTDDADGM
ncbi:MAG: hypothetical protein ACI909_004313 [Planctomycetota bacterium]|jgi:hypothetical protein